MEQKDLDFAIELKELCRKHNIAEFGCNFRRAIEDHSVTHERGFIYKTANQNNGIETATLMAAERRSV